MKILQIVLSLKYGGLENLVVGFSQNLRKRGIESEIVCLAEGGELKLKAEQSGIKVFVLNKKEGFNFKLIFRLAKLLKQQKADIVHTHNIPPLIYGSLAAAMVGIKCLNTRHGRGKKMTNWFIWGLNKFIVAISKDAHNQMLLHNKIDKQKARFIYNGVDIASFSGGINEESINLIKSEIGVQPGSFVVGHIARLTRVKDQETLLKAFQKVIENETKAELVIVGDGPLNQKLRQSASDLGIATYVKFLGYREDIKDLLSVFDVIVLPSLMEGVSLTILEAMAAGKPVIVTNVGGNPEVVVDGETGLLVPSRDPQKMADAIMRILSDPSLARRMGEAGRKRVEEKFSLEKMVNEYEKVYRNILKGVNG